MYAATLGRSAWALALVAVRLPATGSRVVAAELNGTDHRAMRLALLAVLGVDGTLIAADVIAYPSFLDQRGSAAYLAEPVVLLAVYGVVVLAATRSVSAKQGRVLRVGALVGVALGTLEMTNIAVETFADLSGGSGLVATAPMILGPFLVWALVAAWAARTSTSLPMGMLASVWTAMVTMVLGVTFGFALLVVTPDTLAHQLVHDPDYVRSGWTDVRAFVVANTFDNGFTHLLGGLVVASVLGCIGGLVGRRMPLRSDVDDEVTASGDRDGIR